MYEKGLGVERDFHLAKRMYDQCLNTNSGAYVPVNLALLKLYIKWAWLWIRGKAGPVGLGGQAPATQAKDSSKSTPVQEDFYEVFEDEEGMTENTVIAGLIFLGVLLAYWRQQVIQARVPPPAAPAQEETDPLLGFDLDQVEEEEPLGQEEATEGNGLFRRRPHEADASG